MMAVHLSCPYCNAAIVLDRPPVGRRTVCPRCGEAVPVHVAEGEETGEAVDSIPPESALPPPPIAPPRRATLILVAVALAVSALVLVVGLWIVPNWSLQDAIAPPPRPVAATVPPAGVPGLAALPTDTGIALAVQLGPILVHADRTGTDPQKLLTEAGVPEQVFDTLDRLGLSLEQIDHVACGVVLPAEGLLPRVVLVLVLQQPLADEGDFLRRLRATQYTTAEGATRYRGVDVGIPLPMELARLDATTYVFASEPGDLQGLEAVRNRGSRHLAAGLHESMARLSPASVAWVASDAAAWDEKALVKLMAEGAKQPEIRRRLQGVRALAAGLALEPDPTWTASVRGADTTTVQRLEEQARAVVGEPATRSEVQVDGLWVVVQGRGSAEWLRRLLPPRPR